MTAPLPLPHVIQHIDVGTAHGPVLVVLGWLTAATLFLGWCYVRGLRRVRAHPQGRRLHSWRPVALLGGVLVVVLLSLPPLGPMLETRLSTHMVQHIAFIMVAAPLLALGSPGQPLLAGLPDALRRPVVRVGHRYPWSRLAAPHVAWGLQVVALWLWHLPGPYDSAVRSDLLHLLEHACFLTTAWLFWWHLATLSRRRLTGPGAVAYVFLSIAPGAAIGAMLTFSSHPLYQAQASAAAASGIDPLLDQRLGGLVMWVPLDFAYLLVAVVLFGRWLSRQQPLDPEQAPAPMRTREGSLP